MRAALRCVKRVVIPRVAAVIPSAGALCASAFVARAAVAQVAVIPEAPDHNLRRTEYFEQPRRFPFAQIPSGALMRARRDVEARFGLLARSSLPSARFGLAANWRAIGPSTINNGSAAGRVAALAISPTIPGLIYAGAAQGGVWRSENGGFSWTPLGDAQCSLAVGSIAIDPVNPSIIYVGTGEQNNSVDSYYGCGILRSTDGGASWTQFGADVFVSATGGARIGHIVVDRASAGSTTSTTLLASTSFGLYRSTNSGLTWKLDSIANVGAANVSGLIADPVDSRVYYAAIGNYGATAGRNGVFKSIDRGLTWTQLAVSFGGTPGRIELAIAPSAPNVIYATVEDRTPSAPTSQGLLGIWRTSDAGATWTKTAAANASCASQCWYDMYLGVDPTNAARVYFGGLSFYRSEDSAQTFTNVGSSIHVDHHAMVFDPFDPNRIFVGSDGGVYASANRGTGPWSFLNGGLAITQFYHGISQHPADTNGVVGGTQDNGTLQFIGNPSWSSIIGGDGGFTAINPLDASIVFGEVQWQSGSSATQNGPRRRTGVGGFQLKNFGITLTDRAQFIPPYVMDRSNPSTLYFGTFRIFRTTDNAESWSAMSPDLSRTGTGTVTAIGYSPSDQKTLYAGMNDGNVSVTRDSGATWNTISSGLPQRSVTEIIVDEADPTIAYLTVSGFGLPHVWRTTNGGAAWTNISGDLPNIPVNALALIPRSKDLFIGTDLGMFRSDNGGQNWLPFQSGFPNVAVFGLSFNDRTRQLVAATHGRGMFAYSLPALVLRGDVDGDGKVTAADALLVLKAAVGLPLDANQFAFPNGDANCDGVTTALDAQIILAFVAGQSTSQFCVNTVK
jgi:hypothetical protein